MMPPSSPKLDPRLASLREVLLAQESRLTPIPDSHPDTTHAAVSVILRGNPELELLLIKRAEVDGDPWSGHMAFPGGRRDDSDSSLRQTARRETFEETALDLESAGELLGRLRALSPSTFRLPPISIFPFVFGVSASAEARVASREVDQVFWVPLRVFHDPASRSTVSIDLGTSTRDFPCFQVNGRVVWGLTYRILQDFLRLPPVGASMV
jgi:8-oxo-dGTP pyrophosphatase MutT (NUDIX family)